MGVFKKIFNPIYRWLVRRYPSIAFMREYSPKGFEKNEIMKKIIHYTAACGIEGDYLEFGVFHGGTLATAYKLAMQNSKLRSMRFFAFDSFEGLPEPKDNDREQFARGEYKADLARFYKTLRMNAIPNEHVTVVKGWFAQSLRTPPPSLQKAAVVWIDCDLYESTVPVLHFITPYLQDGSILIFDDWFFFRGRSDRGEQKAFKEWLEKNSQFSASEFHKYSWHGNSFIIHKHVPSS